MSKKLFYYIPIFVFIGAFAGAVVGTKYFNNGSLRQVSLLAPLPECGPSGHPDTGELVIVLCHEN